MESGHLFAAIPRDNPEELIDELLGRGSLRIERIVSYGQASHEDGWYDQETHEWVLVVRGRAGLEFEGEPEILELAAGDYVDIPAHLRHRVAWTANDEPTVWLVVHYDQAPP